jgi:NAD(P)H-dependent flavin oxidoreductase YrpB (nitropropane dioxygenase family)
MQAPIGPAATPELVAEVSSAGGMGCLAASWTPSAMLRAQLREIKRRTDRPYCVNLVLAFDQRERIRILIDEDVPVVSLSWGVEATTIAQLQAGGAGVLVQVGDVAAAEQAVAAGCDALVVQGVEAGGHVQGRLPLLDLLAAVRHLPVPLVAAGGISDAAAVVSALDAGATGIAAGTAYLAAREADVHPLYRERLLRSSGTDTVLTGLFDVGWPEAPHRVLRNHTFDTWEAAGRPPAGHRPGEHDEIAARAGHPIVRYSDAQPTCDTDGDIAAMALYTGTGVDHVSALEDAAVITARLLDAP